MFSNLAAIAPFPVPSSPGIGHTFVSCPHPVLPYPRNSLLSKNDCPNRVSSSGTGTDGTVSSMSVLSAFRPAQTPLPSAGSSPPGARDPVARSAPPPHTSHIHRLPGYLIQQPPSLHH